MKTTMENDKKTSQYLFEDEQVFLTENEELFLKEGLQGDPKRLCEVSKEHVEEKVAELQEVFAKLEVKVDESVSGEDYDEKTLNALQDEVKNVNAIGDFKKLLENIEEARAALNQPETKADSDAETATEEEQAEAEVTEEQKADVEDAIAEDESPEKTEVVEEESAEAEDERVGEESADVKESEVDEKKDQAGEVESSEETEIGEAEEPADETETADDSVEDEQPETETAEKEAVEDAGEDQTDETEATESEEDDDPLKYYRDIVKKARDLAKQTDWQYVSMELDNLSHEWSDGPDTDSDEVKDLFKKFNNAVENFEQRKEEHYEELNRQKQENLETKKKLLEEFEGIISNETWTATKRVSQMKRQWNNTGQLPSGKGEDLDKRFNELLDTFNDHKVDRLVQKRQKEEDNLMLKLVVLEKMENVAGSMDHETTDWKEIDEKFEDLTKQWKKIGRVPKEKSNHVWGRYKDAQDLYYDNKYKYDSDHQSKVDKHHHKKEKICEEAEALLEEDDIASAARKINKLHRRWKKAGNLPQRDEDELWARFKSATDAFNERKSKNQEKIREQEEKHYEQKLELIEQAKEVKDTDDFEKGHSKMQSLMDRWKKIGPVPRKKSNKIWKKFKGAMDEFYDRRRDHFKEVKEERKDNLKEKKEILEKLRELGQHSDPIEAVNIAKDLQEKFKNAGYVPIKHKNKMWKQYREACDVIYDRFRAAKSGDKFDQELAKADLDPEDRSKIQKLRKEFKKVKKEVRDLEKEVLQYKEKKTYFKPSDGGNSLLDEVEEKIDKVEQKLEKKQLKLDTLTDQMEDIRAESE